MKGFDPERQMLPSLHNRRCMSQARRSQHFALRAHLPRLPRLADKEPAMQANVIKILRNGVVIIRHALTESQNWPAIELVILKKN